MIQIVNVSPDDTPLTGINLYELRINDACKVRFEHERTANGLARCLRDAANAIEEADRLGQQRIANMILAMETEDRILADSLEVQAAEIGEKLHAMGAMQTDS